MRALQRTGLGFGMVLALSLLFAASAEATLVCTGCSHTEDEFIIDEESPFLHCPDEATKEETYYEIYEDICVDPATNQEFEYFCYRDLRFYYCTAV